MQLARLMLTGANCLLLDEPTNNLDIASAEVLEQALDEFAGTVVVVSHDRYFLDRVVDRIFELRDGELRVYEGGYSYYAEQVARRKPAGSWSIESPKGTKIPRIEKAAKSAKKLTGFRSNSVLRQCLSLHIGEFDVMLNKMKHLSELTMKTMLAETFREILPVRCSMTMVGRDIPRDASNSVSNDKDSRDLPRDASRTVSITIHGKISAVLRCNVDFIE